MWMRSWHRIWRLMPSRAASVQMRMRSGSCAGSALKRRFSSSRRTSGVAPVKDAIRSSGCRSSSASANRFSTQRRVSSYSVKRTSRRSFQRPSGAMLARTHSASRPMRASGRWPCFLAISSISSTRARSETPAAMAPAASAAWSSSSWISFSAVYFVGRLVLGLGTAMDECFRCSLRRRRRRREGALCGGPPRSSRRRRLTREAAAAGRRT